MTARHRGSDVATHLRTARDERDTHERMRAARALLRRPLLHARRDGEDHRIARRHADELRQWFEQETGWHLVVDAEVVRLVKIQTPQDPTAALVAERHAARNPRTSNPLRRRQYVLVCLALAVLERSEQQIALGRLAEQVLLLAQRSGLESLGFTLTTRDDRTDLVVAVRVLLDVGVLVRVAGEEESYIAADGDALYDIDRRVLSRMLVTRHSPSLVDRDLAEEPDIAAIETALQAPAPVYTETERNRRLRHGLTRRLLEEPVLYYDELTADELAYLTGQRAAITRRIHELTGLVPEVRAEGIAMVDPEDQLTDVRMPESGTAGHATLLLAAHLAAAGPQPVSDLHTRMRTMANEHRAYWRRSTQDPGAEVELVRDGLDRLTALGLVRVLDGVASPLPALRRFAVAAPTIREGRAT